MRYLKRMQVFPFFFFLAANHDLIFSVIRGAPLYIQGEGAWKFGSGIFLHFYVFLQLSWAGQFLFTHLLGKGVFFYSSGGRIYFYTSGGWSFLIKKNFHASSWISNGAPLINRQPHFRQINLYVEFYPSFSKVPIEKQVLPTNPFIFVIVWHWSSTSSTF